MAAAADPDTLLLLVRRPCRSRAAARSGLVAAADGLQTVYAVVVAGSGGQPGGPLPWAYQTFSEWGLCVRFPAVAAQEGRKPMPSKPMTTLRRCEVDQIDHLPSRLNPSSDRK